MYNTGLKKIGKHPVGRRTYAKWREYFKLCKESIHYWVRAQVDQETLYQEAFIIHCLIINKIDSKFDKRGILRMSNPLRIPPRKAVEPCKRLRRFL